MKEPREITDRRKRNCTRSPIDRNPILSEHFPTDVQVALQKLRNTIRSAAPQAEEVISYRIPGYLYHGMLIYFAGFKNHCSLFPASKSTLKTFSEELKDFKIAGASTIRFTPDHPLPASLVKKIVKTRMAENEERGQA